MNREHITRHNISRRLARWKRVLSLVTLALIVLCASISMLYASGFLSKMIDMSTLFAIFTAVFSILVPCCICLTLMTLSEPAHGSTEGVADEEDIPSESVLEVDLPHGELVYGDTHIKCRQQILLVLQHMTAREDHFISKSEFSEVLNDASYRNDMESTNAKINTLISNIRATLRELPYEIVNVNRRGYVLNKKEALAEEQAGTGQAV